MKEDDIRAMLEIVSHSTNPHPDFNIVGASFLLLPEGDCISLVVTILLVLLLPFADQRKDFPVGNEAG